jgi:hypothetical protein
VPNDALLQHILETAKGPGDQSPKITTDGKGGEKRNRVPAGLLPHRVTIEKKTAHRLGRLLTLALGCDGTRYRYILRPGRGSWHMTGAVCRT